jgi:hypothetical protein
MSVTFTAGTRAWHDEFQADLLSTTSPEDIEVNMSNSNAHAVALTLGIDLDPDWCGSMPAEDFLGRVLVALAISPIDEGMPSYQMAPGDDAGVFGIVREGGPTFIQGARHPGYLQGRLYQLHELATWAVANGAEILWA